MYFYILVRCFLMSHSKFNYCPFCGARIPQNMMVKYCSFCGGKILLSDNKNQVSQCDEQRIIQEQLVLGNDDHREIDIANYNKMNRVKFVESGYYSIILKDVLNQQSLVHKLEKVLLRGAFAIRLAVDNIPSIIIYKAKSQDTLDFEKIFIEEQASISVISGDFEDKPTVEELFTVYDKLSVQTRKVIENIPIKLWLGDSIHGIYPHTYKDNKEGIMVITDQNIYFVPNNIFNVTYSWFVRSYKLLTKVVMQDNYLELSYKGMRITSITFADKQTMMDAYQSILRAVQIYND